MTDARAADLLWTRADTARPTLGLECLHDESVVSAPLDRTFAFFADASNLQQLTPPWLHFRIRSTTPVVMRAGEEIDYRIRLHGVTIPWRSRIDVWEPGVRFVDRQIAGPYRWWSHEHWFLAVHGGTCVMDRVEYVPRLRWVSAGIVRRDLERIFQFRRAALQRVFREGDGTCG